MITYFSVDIPMIYNNCPKNQTESTCMLRSYLNSEESVFRMLPSTHRLSMKNPNWTVVRDGIDKMHAICADCHEKNLQYTK